MRVALVLNHDVADQSLRSNSHARWHGVFVHVDRQGLAWRILAGPLLRTQLGRMVRDIRSKIGKGTRLREIFVLPLSLARRVREQRQRQRGPKSLHSAAL